MTACNASFFAGGLTTGASFSGMSLAWPGLTVSTTAVQIRTASPSHPLTSREISIRSGRAGLFAFFCMNFLSRRSVVVQAAVFRHDLQEGNPPPYRAPLWRLTTAGRDARSSQLSASETGTFFPVAYVDGVGQRNAGLLAEFHRLFAQAMGLHPHRLLATWSPLKRTGKAGQAGVKGCR